jgi:hypothetical protein
MMPGASWHVALGPLKGAEEIGGARLSVRIGPGDLVSGESAGGESIASLVTRESLLGVRGLTLVGARKTVGSGSLSFLPRFWLAVPAGQAGLSSGTRLSVTFIHGP